MKTHKFLLTVLSLVLIAGVAEAQKLEATSVTPLSKTSKKATQAVGSYNASAQTLQFIYASPKGKSTIFDTYNFDWDLKLTSQNTEEISAEQATAKVIQAIATTNVKYNADYKPREAKATYYKVIVGGGVFNTKLAKGTYTAKEVWSSPLGQYVWSYSASEGAELKLKSDDRKIEAFAALADQPADFINPGFWNFTPDKTFDAAFLVPQKTLTVLSWVSPVNKNTKGTKNVSNQTYVIQTFSTSGEPVLANEQVIKFKGPKMVVQKVQYPDASLGILFAPVNKVPQLGYDQSILHKPNEYTFLHVAPDGKILDSLHFDCPVNAWKPDLCTFADGALYLAGAGSKVDPAKYYFDLKDGKMDHYLIAKIANGKLEYINATPIAQFAANAKKTASQKEAFAFTGRDLANAQLLVENDKIVVVGQYIYRGKNLDYLLFQFDGQGNLKAQYTVSNETEFAGASRLFTNPDGKTITWMITGTKKVDEKTQRKFQYVQMATINPEALTMSNFTAYGPKSKEQKVDYFLNPETPMVVLDKHIILIGADEDNESLWLAKVALGVE